MSFVILGLTFQTRQLISKYVKQRVAHGFEIFENLLKTGKNDSSHAESLKIREISRLASILLQKGQKSAFY